MSQAGAALAIPAELQKRQREASDPASSIWVSANAGSGKTHVLTQRVIRLLLAGVAPAQILCLTFTKAAAAQMSTRVFETLSRWTDLDDKALRDAIETTGAPTPTPADLLRARRLFTRTVETPGGLKIQTIHAFCERLLHLFPFEANVPARFEVADERRTLEMQSLARRGAIAAMQGSAELALIADTIGSADLSRLIGQAMSARTAARRAGPLGADRQAALAARLGGRFATVDACRREMIDAGIGPARWPVIADVLDTGRKTDAKYAAWLRGAAATSGSDAAETLDVYLSVFFDGDGEPRKTLLTKALAAQHPGILAELIDEQNRLIELREQLWIAAAVERTQALVALADKVVETYERAKAAQGLLDFDDLIERTLALLEHSSSSWVLYKLDAGIDHVLVDEAQDTSAPQWQILEQLTGEFASGAGARERARSFFAVGDEKQSIFSFQGAAPDKFDEMHGSFARRFRLGVKPFARIALKTSFRSVQTVLDSVDTVFASEAHRDGLLGSVAEWPKHDSIKSGLPGLVEIWPKVAPVAAEQPADWSIPLDVPTESDPVNVVADRIARKIKALVSTDSPDRVCDGHSGVTRPIRPGDVIVLVRTRNAFFEALIRALKRHYVDVAGADRLDVANHIAVLDLVAAGRSALLPVDDLSLACLLKSPLFGLTDDDLIALAPKRRGSLFGALAGSADPAHRAAHAVILRWAARAVDATPFAFYVELLGREGGRRLIEARLGPEAHDAIDEFLRLALVHEQQGAPSLGCFLADVEALESSVKRDMEAPGDAVRVMTVHAAKGLEAKIVVLADTCAIPDQRLDPTVFDLDDGTAPVPLLVWSPRKGEDPALVRQARDAVRRDAMREYRRLLYVALTRAEERLYIAGFEGIRGAPDDCWYAMIDRAFPEAEQVEAPWGGEPVRRIAPTSAVPLAIAAQGKPGQSGLPILPRWLEETVASTAMPSPLRPSFARIGPWGAERRQGMVFGEAMHLLLQELPGLPREHRAAAARRALAMRADLPPGTREALVEEALAVIAAPALAALFGPDARAEVPIIGRLACRDGSEREVRGVVDRLVVTAHHVVIADFKTGEPQDPPPEAYVGQLALYARVLGHLWPSRALAVWLVWTRGPRVMEIHRAALDAAAAARLASA